MAGKSPRSQRAYEESSPPSPPPTGNLNTRRHLKIKKIKKKRRVFKGYKNV